MNVHEIKSRISETLSIPVAKLRDDALISDIVTESFAVIEMVIDLQEEFGVRLGQEDLKGLKTIGALTSLIASRVAKAA
jgi:acyl carrier protein